MSYKSFDCTIPWFSVLFTELYSQYQSILGHFHHSKKKPMPFGYLLCVPSAPQP